MRLLNLSSHLPPNRKNGTFMVKVKWNIVRHWEGSICQNIAVPNIQNFKTITNAKYSKFQDLYKFEYSKYSEFRVFRIENVKHLVR